MSDIFFVATTASAAWFYRVRAFLWSVLQFQSSLAHEIWHWELFCIFGRLWTSFMICTLWNYAHSLAFSTFRTLQYSSASIYQKPQFWWVERSKMEFGAQEGPLIIKSGCLGSCNNKIARTNFLGHPVPYFQKKINHHSPTRNGPTRSVYGDQILNVQVRVELF